MTSAALLLLAAATLPAEPNGPVAHAARAPIEDILIWNDHGQQRSAKAAALAAPPPGSRRIGVRTLVPGGKPILEVRLSKGQHFSPNPPGDIRIYVASGRLLLEIAGTKDMVSAGDAFFETAGQPVLIEVLEDTMLIEFPAG